MHNSGERFDGGHDGLGFRVELCFRVRLGVAREEDYRGEGKRGEKEKSRVLLHGL